MMSKLALAAAAAALFTVLPAAAQTQVDSAYDANFRGGVRVAAGDVNGDGAQDRRCGFDGRNGSASNFSAAPSADPTAGKPGNPRFQGPHGSASDLTAAPPADPTAASSSNNIKQMGIARSASTARCSAPAAQAPNRRPLRGEKEPAPLLLPAVQKVREAAARQKSAQPATPDRKRAAPSGNPPAAPHVKVFDGNN